MNHTIQYDGHKYALLQDLGTHQELIGIYPTQTEAEQAYKQRGGYGELVHTTSTDPDATPTL